MDNNYTEIFDRLTEIQNLLKEEADSKITEYEKFSILEIAQRLEDIEKEIIFLLT
jgi:hypothetical protein